MDDFSAYADDLRIWGYSERTIDTYLRAPSKVPHSLPGTLREAKAWLAQRQQSVQLRTVAVDVRALKSYSRWRANEYQAPDPLDRLEHPEVPQAKPGRIAPNGDVARVRATLSPHVVDYRTPVRHRAIFSTFVYTGIRRSELVRLRLDDVDLEGRRLIIQPGKNGEGRTVPLHDNLARDLRLHLRTERARHRCTRIGAAVLLAEEAYSGTPRVRSVNGGGGLR